LRKPLELVGSFDRPNLVYRVLPCTAMRKQLELILARHRDQAGIIYCQSRWRAVLEANGEWNDGRRALMRDMERYAGSVSCRHRRLVAYFGETLEKDDCGACDFCLGELEPVSDPVTLARKILSAVARVGQRFGAAHVTNVLRGSQTEAVTARGHDQLSVFGLLQGARVDEVRAYIDQLIAWELLRQAGDEFPILQLTPEGAALMRDAGAAPDLRLARQRVPEKGKPARRTTAAEAASWEGVDRDLFERLRALRLQIARDRGVPSYVIFHDTTLRELARLRPGSAEDLRHVYGIGAKKAQDLGELILRAIQAG
jgi:ATP-dependent DNA helicase RecQ